MIAFEVTSHTDGDRDLAGGFGSPTRPRSCCIPGIYGEVMTRLTHVDETGAAHMVDVTGKDVSTRRAVATGLLRTTTQVAELLAAGALPKGDALAVARVAGIMAAKRTPDLLPLCHPIALGALSVDLEVDPDGTVTIRASVKTNDRTGVEMEALTAVAIAGLTLIDMIKAVDPHALLDQIRVESKEGGATGAWIRE